MKPRARRGLAIVCGLAALGIACALVLNAFSSNLVFFFSPSQIAADEAPRLAELLGLKSYAELKLVDHFTTWSMVDFLLQKKPAEFSKFIWAMKSNQDEKGLPTGSNLLEWHRTAFKDAFGWNYPEFDEAWRTWAKEAYKPGIPKGGELGPVIPGSGLPPGGGG